jgi:signal transduction histidine kinase
MPNRRVAETHELASRVPLEGTRDVRDVAAALNRMLEQLEQLETASGERERALRSTRRFVSDAGHELRTPLATLGANLETLVHRPDLAADQREEILAESLAEQQRL